MGAMSMGADLSEKTNERVDIAKNLYNFAKNKRSELNAPQNQAAARVAASKKQVREIAADNLAKMMENSQKIIWGKSSQKFTELQTALANYQESVGKMNETNQLRALRTAAKAYIKYKNDQGPDKWTANGKERVKIAKLIGKFSSISIAELTKQQPAPKRQVAQAQNNALNINNVNNDLPKRGRGILSK